MIFKHCVEQIDYPYLRVSWKDDRWNPLGDSNWCKSVGIYCSREREIKFYPLVIFQLDWRTAASEAVRGCRRGWKNFSSIFDSFQEDDGWRLKEKRRKREEAQWLKITKKSYSIFENLNLAVKQWYQTGPNQSVKNWLKIPKLKKFECDILDDF